MRLVGGNYNEAKDQSRKADNNDGNKMANECHQVFRSHRKNVVSNPRINAGCHHGQKSNHDDPPEYQSEAFLQLVLSIRHTSLRDRRDFFASFASTLALS
jgi:hypothetical protein